VPDASPRSVTGIPAGPPSCQVSQSCGSSTRSVRAAAEGSCVASQRSLVTVNEAVGTLPVCEAHHAGPPSSSISEEAAAAERTSFHSSAGLITRPASSSAIMPCCCAATPIAPERSSSPAPAWLSASHQNRGSVSVPSGCGALRCSTTVPSSASQRTTLVDWVEESIPATSMEQPYSV